MQAFTEDAGVRRTSLLAALVDGSAAAGVTFAGQAVDALPELAALTAERPELVATLEAMSTHLAELADANRAGTSGRFRHGIDVAAWARDPDAAPPPVYLASAAVSFPLILLTQALRWRALCADGVGEACAANAFVAVTGHSQGVLAAAMIAETEDGSVDDDCLRRWLTVAFELGVFLARAARAPVSLGTDAPDLTPMVSVRGVRSARLRAVVDAVAARVSPDHAPFVALTNTPTRHVVGGTPDGLAVLHAELTAQAHDEAERRRLGHTGGAPLRFTWTPLDVEAAFHSPALEPHLDDLVERLDAAKLVPDGATLVRPVLSPIDGTDLRDVGPRLAYELARAVCAAPVRWDVTTRALVDRGAAWILDVGPGTDIARCSAECVRGTGARVLALASPEGRRILATAGAAPAGPDVRYADFAPGIVTLDDGRRHVDNRYTRIAGAPPVFLPGMTPTTVDAPIVAAAANAGYVAELAGGGQRTARVFRTRIDELRELLDPGAEIVLNALFFDRPLWNLHWAVDALLLSARRAGAPISGMTVSAGIPEVEEAIGILDRLAAHGMVRNAFKAGTADQVEQVLAIADGAPHHTVFVHLEGGKAGGHHSWEDLDELLLEHYDALRRRPNVVLCVGGGIGTPEQAAALLTGTWALAHDELAMPVDAVFVGTVAMACREAAASPAVKAALVAATGTDAWVARRGSDGGVTSGRSNLNADIHCLDNRAAQVGHVLEEVAGDNDAVAARRDEIIDLLEGTARPYFGDLEAMTYLAVLERLVELMAVGHDGRYDDGRWRDPTWRGAALEVFRVFAARLAPLDTGLMRAPVAVGSDLDDPEAALAAFAAEYPRARTTLLHPSDARRVVAACSDGVKPVPFVPVLDGEVRRWFMADALWQAQDDRYGADGVIVIPGPESVRGIERADEPVADVLDRFERATLDRLAREHAPTSARDRLTDEGLAPAHLARVATGRRGPIAALLVTPSVVTVSSDGPPVSQANALWSLIRASDEIEVEVDDAVITRVVARVWGAASESVVLELADHGVASEPCPTIVARVTMPEFDGRVDELTLQFRPLDQRRWDAGFEVVDLDHARRTFAATALRTETPARTETTGADDHHHIDRWEAEWSLDAATLDAYRAVTGARHDGMPVDLAFTLAWPALASALSTGELGSSLPDLLHQHHTVTTLAAWPPQPGEHGTAVAALVAIERDDTTSARVRVELATARGPLATVEAGLVVLGTSVATDGAGSEHRTTTHDVVLVPDASELAFLAAQEWWHAVASTPSAVLGDRLHVVATTHVARASHVPPCEAPASFRATGTVTRGDEIVARVVLDREGDEGAHPVDAVLAMLAPAPPVRVELPHVDAADTFDDAPPDMASFARIGGDRNPLHRSVLAARLAGLDAPIVHGLWIAARAEAFAVDALADRDPARIDEWEVQFVAPVSLGAALELRASRTAREQGSTWYEIIVHADGAVAAIARARVRSPRTALLFPGQGAQRVGMADALVDRSRAARAMWAAADECTRARLGFSIVEVVTRNPRELRLADGAVVRHPDGLLFRTEFTQVALVVQAAAQVAELRAEGMIDDDTLAMGHSVGECSALVALGVLALDDAVELVYRRGLAMQAHVTRDDQDRTGFALAVVDPGAFDLTLASLESLVARIVEAQRHAGVPDALLQVVNHNAHGRQYAVAGSLDALDELGRCLGTGRARGGYQRVRGVDVPFHSSALAPAVAGYRADLERLVHAVDPELLVGRWIPNLVGTAFSTSPEFVATVAARSGDDLALPAETAPDDEPTLARRLVIELLAAQIARPVRWADSVDVLVASPAAGGLGARQLVEIAPPTSRVLTDLVRGALPTSGPGVAMLHSETDRAVLAGESLAGESLAASVPSDAAPTPPVAVHPPNAAPTGVPIAAGAPAPDRPVTAGDALRMVLALQAKVRPDQLRDDETIEELFQGVSSRRNQVLIDLGREFALAGTEGVHEVPFGRLVQELPGRVPRYRFPGPYLAEVLSSGTTRALGGSGVARRDAVAHLGRAFGFTPDTAERVLATVVIDTRAGPSARGGTLARLGDAAPSTSADALALLERAAALEANDAGVALSRPASVGAAMVNSEEVGGLARRMEDALLGSARALAEQLGRPFADATTGLVEPNAAHDRLNVLDDEHGTGRATDVTPRFDARRHVGFVSPWASARFEVVAAWHDAIAGRLDDAALSVVLDRLAMHANDPAVVATAGWLARRAEARQRPDVAAHFDALRCARRVPLAVPATRPRVEIGAGGDVRAVDEPADDDRIGALLAGLDGDERAAHAALYVDDDDARHAWAQALHASRHETLDFSRDTALVTGASPGSIAAEVVRWLLRGGATVVVATSTDTPERRAWYRDLCREVAAPGAALHVLPVNLASLADVDALVEWLDDPTTAARGRPDLRLSTLVPTIVLPFAAVATVGEAPDAGAASEIALRVQLLGVQRLVGGIADLVARRGAAPATVVLPLSPNHGDFGGDVPYGETKAALEVLLRRQRSERSTWGRHVSILAARIGWVRGTGLMGVNDAVASLVEERLDVRTFSTAEMGWLLAAACTEPVRAHAAGDVLELGLTGGLDRVDGLRDALAPLGAELVDRALARGRATELDTELARRLGRPSDDDAREVEALPGLPDELSAVVADPAASPASDAAPSVQLSDLVVIVGAGELGPCGSAATRFELEVDGALTAAGIGELAWMCGLVKFERDGARGTFVDVATGEPVAEEELADRYRADVTARVGLRALEADGVIDPDGIAVLSTVHLESDITFDVADEDEARRYVAADPDHTRVACDASGAWRVTRQKGAPVRVTQRVPHSRRVAGQFPTGLDLGRLGVPADLLASADRLALVNLVCTVDAFRDAGLEPEELVAEVHPALVANTQGAGMGGLTSLRRLLLDHLLDDERQNDRLQESLINVIAAHVVQGYVGSYGPMVHPVAACATAGVSLEEAVDKIRGGKALVALGGGFDDLTPEGMIGFGDMHATADSDELDAMGIAPRESSRANDVRRRGFVESQGGGSFLVARGDVALALGLPVRAVVAYVSSFGDGIQSSVPAPGLGALAAVRGGEQSPLGQALHAIGLTADDISVVSKHDTSTEMNDPSEADIHQRIQDALGRTPGNPLLVVSQKSVTGHSKGGAAAWQLAGVLQMMDGGVVPGNRNLECADPMLEGHHSLVHGDRALHLAPGERVTAALLTSLGFGHVSVVAAFAHPDVYLAAVPEEQRSAYVERSTRRRADGTRRRLAARLDDGADVLRRDRRFAGRAGMELREREAQLLTDPAARLGSDGAYVTGKPAR